MPTKKEKDPAVPFLAGLVRGDANQQTPNSWARSKGSIFGLQGNVSNDLAGQEMRNPDRGKNWGPNSNTTGE